MNTVTSHVDLQTGTSKSQMKLNSESSNNHDNAGSYGTPNPCSSDQSITKGTFSI